ncbi:FMN-binding glutamate synthase family protein, partial [Xanthomonas citri pv. citri]|nr:FMN-binding glutamate synthase family protein [Xanthomonas citri pv. citri]
MRKIFILGSILALLLIAALAYFLGAGWLWLLLLVLPLVLMGIYDMIQVKHSIMRTYPVVGRMRFW